MIPLHLTVPNPYAILTQTPEDTAWFIVLDLKDAFFCIPVHSDSQYLFTFEWTDPDTNMTQQYTWTVLPEGFWDRPHLFGNALAKELKELTLEMGALLHYVNDLLIFSPSEEASDQNTVQALSFLGSG